MDQTTLTEIKGHIDRMGKIEQKIDSHIRVLVNEFDEFNKHKNVVTGLINNAPKKEKRVKKKKKVKKETGETEFVCPKCDRRLASRGSLFRHMEQKSCMKRQCMWMITEDRRCSNMGNRYCHLHKRIGEVVELEECIQCTHKLGYYQKIQNFVELQKCEDRVYGCDITYEGIIYDLKSISKSYAKLTSQLDGKEITVWKNAKARKKKEGITLSRLRSYHNEECKNKAVVINNKEDKEYCHRCFEWVFKTSIESVIPGFYAKNNHVKRRDKKEKYIIENT